MSKKYKILRKVAFVVSIIFTVFISIFAVDVFFEGYSSLETIVALFFHLVPTIFLVAVILIARKSELIAGIIFALLSVVSTIFFHTYEDIIVFLIVSFPPLLVGILFLIANKLKKHN